MHRLYVWIESAARWVRLRALGVERWAEGHRLALEPPPPPPEPEPEPERPGKVVRSGRGVFSVGDVFSDPGGIWRVTNRTQRSDHVEYRAEKLT